jgi:hypothetical protein
VPEHVGVAFTRAKVGPMVHGLFSKVDQDVMLRRSRSRSCT